VRLVERQIWRVMADRPNALGEMLLDKDAGKSERVIDALVQMKKIDIQRLKAAYEGR
jgi:predicted 3-demethylubiquinone-9 3-methyltransferase (glyoxalase superfamily)